MSSKEEIESRRKYWEGKKDDFVTLLDNWLKHDKRALSVSVDELYDEYLKTGIETSELSQYKYGKDLQNWFDSKLTSKQNV